MHSSKQLILIIPPHLKHWLFGMVWLLFLGGMLFEREIEACKLSAGGGHFPRLTMQVGDTTTILLF